MLCNIVFETNKYIINFTLLLEYNGNEYLFMNQRFLPWRAFMSEPGNGICIISPFLLPSEDIISLC
jgi:hypothetical protein